MRHVGNDVGESRFAGARRAGKDHGRQTIGFDRAAQEFSRPENMFLTDKLVERPRSHSCGERRSALRAGGCFGFLSGKKIVHGGKYGACVFSASHFQIRTSAMTRVSCSSPRVLDIEAARETRLKLALLGPDKRKADQ